MKNWCRIIELEAHDVLIKRSFDDDEQNVEVIIQTRGIEVNKIISFKHKDSDKADDLYKEIDKEFCIKFINEVETAFFDLNINQKDEDEDEK